MSIDLHLHTRASDGVLTPMTLAKKAASMGISIMAITDHDTFDGVAELHGKALPLRVLQGVELSLSDRKNMHLLGYGLREETLLHDAVKQLAVARVDRAKKMLALLRKNGMPLEEDALFAQCGSTVGRPHIARMLVEREYVHSVTEAFQRYLGDGCRCYVAGERLCLKEALTLMRRSGFVPVMAHPRLMGLGDAALNMLLPVWRDQGLLGVEVYHPSAESKGYAPLDHMARRNGLLVTGGSDFHEEGDGHGLPGCTNGAWANAQTDFTQLETTMQQEAKGGSRA